MDKMGSLPFISVKNEEVFLGLTRLQEKFFSKEEIKKMGADALSSNLFCALMAIPPEILLAGMDF